MNSRCCNGCFWFVLLTAITCTAQAELATNAGWEIESNNTSATAMPLPAKAVRIRGNISPSGDLDYYSFTAQAGDRVYAALMTAASANSSDSLLSIIASDGTTILETDDSDGSFSSTSSSIAGTVIPNSGTYYLRVKEFSTSEIRPYDLWVSIRSGSPTPETEPNDSISPQALPSSGWVIGNTSPSTDQDHFSISLNAGDTVFLSLDLDPERDSLEWPGQLAFGLFAGSFLSVDDVGHAGPDSEAFFMTVKNAGTYYIRLSSSPTTVGTYYLSASVLPASAQSFTTYISTNVPLTLPAGPGIVSSTLTVPDNKRINRLKLFLNLNHTNMPDLDVSLTAPDGNTIGLFTDVGMDGFPNLDIAFDDDAAIPLTYTALSGQIFRPEASYRLDWFKGQQAQGTWTLNIRDDAAGGGGTLNSWSLAIAEEPTPAGTPMIIYTNDFETGDGGFTHSGIQDEWQRGLPAFDPITNCNSGINCWKTDLIGTYNASATNDLFSPSINLASFRSGDLVVMTWAMKFQIQTATSDDAFVEAQEIGGSGLTRKLWEWAGPTMTDLQGNPNVTIQEAAGWGMYRALLTEFAGKTIRLRFRFESDATTQLAGWAIDDVAVVIYPGIVKYGSDFAVNFFGQPDCPYRIQFATNLASPVLWNEFIPPATLTAPDLGIFTYTNVAPPDAIRFYRTIPVP